MPKNRLVLLTCVLALAGCTADGPVGVVSDASQGDIFAAKQGTEGVFPGILPLPDGFAPEGIATGRGTHFYVGSFSGAIYRGDLRTGVGNVFVAPDPGRTAVGLAADPRSDLLYVAGGPLGTAYVYDASTGEAVADYAFQGAGFVNDVVVTREAAYFTDSFQPVLYRVTLGPGGTPTDQAATIPLSGDFTFVPGNFNTNGIAATPSGKHLIIVNSGLGMLYRVDPGTGVATSIDLAGGSVPNGDGLVLEGSTLYVVQNFLNQIAVIALDPKLTSGEVEGTITDEAFRIPTTAAAFGDALYAVNARFDVAPPFQPAPDIAFEVVRVRR